MTGRAAQNIILNAANEDFYDLMKVFNEPDINEFQYTIEGDEWIMHLK